VTPAELDEMERAAKAATPGPYAVSVYGYHVDFVRQPSMERIFVARAHLKADAEHIAAANPETVLRLIAYARRLEALLPEAFDAGRFQNTSTGTNCDAWLADALARAREGSK
jgi:hypothetical protein